MSTHHENPARRRFNPSIRPNRTDNASRNREAWKRMTVAEQMTGRTVEELAAEQALLREAFYARRAA